MSKIVIDKTDRTPELIIDTDNGFFSMEYDSRPEDVRKFYYPILEKLKSILENIKQAGNLTYFKEKPFVFTFKLGYFNSSSAKFILDILNIVKLFKEGGINVEVNWYYFEDEDDMKEAGEDFSEFCEVEFNYFIMEDDDDE